MDEFISGNIEPTAGAEKVQNILHFDTRGRSYGFHMILIQGEENSQECDQVWSVFV